MWLLACARARVHVRTIPHAVRAHDAERYVRCRSGRVTDDNQVTVVTRTWRTDGDKNEEPVSRNSSWRMRSIPWFPMWSHSRSNILKKRCAARIFRTHPALRPGTHDELARSCDHESRSMYAGRLRRLQLLATWDDIRIGSDEVLCAVCGAEEIFDEGAQVLAQLGSAGRVLLSAQIHPEVARLHARTAAQNRPQTNVHVEIGESPRGQRRAGGDCLDARGCCAARE